MGMLVFISKAPERSLHYESRSKSPGLLTFLGLVAGPITLCAWGSEKDFSQFLSTEMGPPISTYYFPPYGTSMRMRRREGHCVLLVFFFHGVITV